jgi:hypothetical protein
LSKKRASPPHRKLREKLIEPAAEAPRRLRADPQPFLLFAAQHAISPHRFEQLAANIGAPAA